jgi:mono/diheme cytochrome c family protein
LAAVLATFFIVAAAPGVARAGFPWLSWWRKDACEQHIPPGPEIEGTWFWMRSPDEEKRVIAGLYNRYCVRCHGIDGRGVWDIPDVPDFTSPKWQACRSDPQIVRIILEGRGAIMPPFRGTLTLEEAWGMARYLRTFIPGTEESRPDTGKSDARTDKKNDKAPPPKEANLPQPKVEPGKPAAE